MSAFITILRDHYQEFRQAYGRQISDDIHAAMMAMCGCQRGTLGYTHWDCEHCQHGEQHPISCGHRHCPQCQYQCSRQWLTRQQNKQLPVNTFMVTFTLPAQLRGLAQHQPKALYTLMFSVCSSVLKDFALRQHGGQSGFTLVLHTHSRRRDCHPHIHALIPAGYYDKQRQQWHKGNKQSLYHVHALAKVWRGRMLNAINAHPALNLPAATLPSKWVVDCRPVGQGERALQYLSRYLYRGVLADKNILSVDHGEVTFRYQDSTSKQWCTRTLQVLKFLWLILQHVLPKGFQRVRNYGLCHCSGRDIRTKIILMLLKIGWQLQLPHTPTPTKACRYCSRCKQPMTFVGITRPS